jgi:hypothetical protein
MDVLEVDEDRDTLSHGPRILGELKSPASP